MHVKNELLYSGTDAPWPLWSQGSFHQRNALKTEWANRIEQGPPFTLTGLYNFKLIEI